MNRAVPESHNNSKIERTNLDVLEGTRCALIQAGLPECFWPFAAPHYCFLENTSKIDHQGNVYPDGSPYRVAHDSDEPNVKRLPFGCEVVFIPSSTKTRDAPTKWEGVAIPGVIAGYRMGPGYKWGGEYLVWSLRELTRVNYRVDAKNFPLSIRSPHVVGAMRLPNGDEIRFPLKAEYDRVNYTLEGLRDKIRRTDGTDFDEAPVGPDIGIEGATRDSVEQLVGTETADTGEVAESVKDPYGEIGVVLNDKGERCKYDALGRLYRIDEFGSRILANSSRPPYFPTELWKKLSAKD